jgi:glucokinase
MNLVTVDIGGTHARFALAKSRDGACLAGRSVTLKTAEHASFPDRHGRRLPHDLPASRCRALPPLRLPGR